MLLLSWPCTDCEVDLCVCISISLPRLCGTRGDVVWCFMACCRGVPAGGSEAKGSRRECSGPVPVSRRHKDGGTMSWEARADKLSVLIERRTVARLVRGANEAWPSRQALCGCLGERCRAGRPHCHDAPMPASLSDPVPLVPLLLLLLLLLLPLIGYP